MALYVVQAQGQDRASLERAVLIRDGFSWAAFVFAQLWLLVHRLWLPLVIWIGLEFAFVLLIVPHVSALVSASVAFLAHLFIGLEGNRLRLAKGARRAGLVDIVEGSDREAAELRFFHRHMTNGVPDGIAVPLSDADARMSGATAAAEVRA